MSSNTMPRLRSASGSSMTKNDRPARAGTPDYPSQSKPIMPIERHFEPCAATAGMFLYVQGSSVVCCHHDTLTIERRFSGHSEEIQLMAVDIMSERGAGRLVVTYDAGQNAIVWDLLTGTEVARFASFSNLTAVSWMRNGTVAFGNDAGIIILFEPETSEHMSVRTIPQIAVTALAPAADCRTFAVGYQNGSLLVCTLQPRFTILHSLTTSRGPSPIISLAWHASSAKQKSDMLAAQTYDGDLRVWSVAKSHHSQDPAKVVRILKRTENFVPGPNWMGWSKNGRIIQFSEGETLSWDVRTKHVTYDSIPTLEHVRGLAVYGPGASLFTLGANNTAQQFDLNAPAVLVADVQHPANLPPSPPVSVEEQEKASAARAAGQTTEDTASFSEAVTSSAATTSESEISIHLDGGVSESDEDHMSPFARMVHAQALETQAGPAYSEMGMQSSVIERTLSPGVSSDMSGYSSASGNSYNQAQEEKYHGHAQASHSYSRHRKYQPSTVSRGLTENTYLSVGSSLQSTPVPSVQQRPLKQPRQSASTLTGTSILSSAQSLRSGTSGLSGISGLPKNRPSRLRNEVPRSPDDAKVYDLFKFTRSRLSDIPYGMPSQLLNSSNRMPGDRLTNDDLRRQMLRTIFGWPHDVDDLVRDEMNSHPAGSANRILLAKWLGDLNADIMSTTSASMTSSDWMLLALSGIGSEASQHKLGRAYTQRLLESGDVHAAATIMIGMGDHNDAIEIYVSHHKYMEALIVTGLFFPAVWERQSFLITKWGEWAIKNGQKQLAIRCSACSGQESSEPWTSPSATQITFQSINAALPEALSPPLSPPSVMQRGPQRSIAKSSALRLITNFGEDGKRSNFYSGQEDGATPIAAGVTPIVDSAITPGLNSSGEVTTAFLRPSQRSAFNTPSSARPNGPAGFGRQRLPSIGEAPTDATNSRLFRTQKTTSANEETTSDLPTPPVDAGIQSLHSRSVSPKAMAVDSLDLDSRITDEDRQQYMIGMTLQRAATSSPLYRRKDRPLPSPSPASMAMLMESSNANRRRNGSRDRIPGGVELQINLDRAPQKEVMSLERDMKSGASSAAGKYRWPSRRRGPASVSSSITSNSTATSGGSRRYNDPFGQSISQNHNRLGAGDVINTRKNLDDYINSLEAARLRARPSSRERERQEKNQSRASNRQRDAASVTTSGTTTPQPAIFTIPPVQSITPSAASSRGGKRSPRSPVPMSPEDLMNLSSTPRMFGRDQPADMEVTPLTVRKTTGAAAGPPSDMPPPPPPPPPAQIRPSSRTSRSRPRSRSSSRSRSNTGATGVNMAVRHQSPERRAVTPGAEMMRLHGSSRTGSQSGLQMRSPMSPQPLLIAPVFGSKGADAVFNISHNAGSSDGDSDEQDFARALEEQERFRLRDRKATARKERAATGPPPAPSAIAVASGIGSEWTMAAIEDTRKQSASVTSNRSGRSNKSRGNIGDLHQLSTEERALRKAAAARELEERRSLLAQRPAAPAAPAATTQAEELLPATTFSGSTARQPPHPEQFELKIPDMFASPHSLPKRSQSTEPGAQSRARTSMMSVSQPSPAPQTVSGTSRNSPRLGSSRGTPIGLPATPKAMRLVLEQGAGATASVPSVPPIPTNYVYKRSPPGSGHPSPTEVPAAANTNAPTSPQDTLTLLPSTVYQPPSRSTIPRSMSAPPIDFGRATQPRKMSRSKPFANNDTVAEQGESVGSGSRRPSVDAIIPPPPRPPMLKELAHLAMPPPPPPAPLPYGHHASYGGQSGNSTGTIEVVMDDSDDPMSPQMQLQMQMGGGVSQPQNDVPPPPPPPPPPPAFEMSQNVGSRGHQRGRSSTDNSLAGRISRATERMRSASRGGNGSSTAAASRTAMSPETQYTSTFAPYESVATGNQMQSEVAYLPYESVPPPPAYLLQGAGGSSASDTQHVFRTGLHQSEMI